MDQVKSILKLKRIRKNNYKIHLKIQQIISSQVNIRKSNLINKKIVKIIVQTNSLKKIKIK